MMRSWVSVVLIKEFMLQIAPFYVLNLFHLKSCFRQQLEEMKIDKIRVCILSFCKLESCLLSIVILIVTLNVFADRLLNHINGIDLARRQFDEALHDSRYGEMLVIDKAICLIQFLFDLFLLFLLVLM